MGDLEQAGIRFVYTSREGDQACKAFGERLGLETDWNSCILLSTPPNSGTISQLDYSHPKSRLPRGLDNIRPHLRHTDDIPLHVSLLADCTPRKVAEMIHIYR